MRLTTQNDIYKFSGMVCERLSQTQTFEGEKTTCLPLYILSLFLKGQSTILEKSFVKCQTSHMATNNKFEK